jgi:hypothetical protein
MEKKEISINPELFDLTKKKKKEKKQLPLKVTSENKVKKELINKIKNHQKTKKKKINSDEQNNSKDSFSNSFNSSMSYLKNIINESKLSIKEKNNDPIIHTSLPKALNSNEIQILDDKPWGNLKNGNKPTYKSWLKKTQKNNISPSSIACYPEKSNNKKLNIDDYPVDESPIDDSPIDDSPIDDSPIDESPIDDSPLDESSNKYFTIENENLNKLNEQVKNKPQLKKKKFKKKTTRKKYKCGKSKTKKIISVLIKGPDTKDKINKEINQLSIAPLRDIKKYLYDRSLIKFGSNAPDDIIRTMYESCILSGDIKNDNSEMIIHNYFNST